MMCAGKTLKEVVDPGLEQQDQGEMISYSLEGR